MQDEIQTDTGVGIRSITSIDLKHRDDSGNIVAYGDVSNDSVLAGNIIRGESSYSYSVNQYDLYSESGLSSISSTSNVGDISLEYFGFGIREIETETGSVIEFEGGGQANFFDLKKHPPEHEDPGAPADLDLTHGAYFGAQGDARNNYLTALNATYSVNLIGFEGNDTLIGGNGADFISGDSGVDELFGGAGDDVIHFDLDDTIVSGGLGKDAAVFDDVGAVSFDLSVGDFEVLVTGSGADTINAFNVARRLTIDGQAGADQIFGGSKSDQVFGGLGADTIEGREGNDRLSGGENSDLLIGFKGSDRIFGGKGTDTIFGGDHKDYLDGGVGADSIVGDAGADFLSGGNGADILSGGTGSDLLVGDKGNDTLEGNEGDDGLIGGVGADHLYGGDGNDTLNGGDNNDTAHFDYDKSSSSFTLTNDILTIVNGTETDQILNVETLAFADGRAYPRFHACKMFLPSSICGLLVAA